MTEILLSVRQAIELSTILQSIKRPPAFDLQTWQAYINLERDGITHEVMAQMIEHLGDDLIDRLRSVHELPSESVSFAALGGGDAIETL